MTAATTYRYSLDKSSKKHICPDCRQKSLVLYIDAETSGYLPEHVGRCDRENRCGYHYTPKQWKEETGQPIKPNSGIVEKPMEPVTVDHIPVEIMQQSFNGVLFTSFVRFLIDLFGTMIAIKQAQLYNIGRSKLDGGKACTFWQVDISGNVRSGKIVAYNETTGKRLKEPEAIANGRGLRDKEGNYIACLSVNWLVREKLGNKNLNFQLCFFGEHLLTVFPDKIVGIVESEKSAVICSIYMPSMVWLATGGQSGCRWRDYAVHKVLSGRNVVFFPDYGFANKKTGKTCYEDWSERVKVISEHKQITGIFSVSDLLEKQLAGQERDDRDLADILVQRDDLGLAVDDEGDPLLFGLNYADYGIKLTEDMFI